MVKLHQHQKIFIVCKTPEEVRKLIDGGVPINEVNVGNMHFDKGKRQISKKVYVDDKDLEDLRAIRIYGNKSIYSRCTRGLKKISINRTIKYE